MKSREVRPWRGGEADEDFKESDRNNVWPALKGATRKIQHIWGNECLRFNMIGFNPVQFHCVSDCDVESLLCWFLCLSILQFGNTVDCDRLNRVSVTCVTDH